MKIIKTLTAKLKKSPKVLSVLFLLCLLAALIYSLANHPASPKFVTFDMKSEIATFQSNLVNSTLSVAQQQSLAAEFMTLMNQDVNNYAATHNVVVLVKGAVVSGNVRDITAEIQQQLMTQVSAKVQTLGSGS